MDRVHNFSEEGIPGDAVTIDRTAEDTEATPRKRIAAAQVMSVIRRAQTFQTQGHFNDAIDLYEQILESGFDRPDARYSLGLLYQRQQCWNDAICQFQKLLNDPDYALSCYRALGQCYRAHGDLHTALTYFYEAVDRIDPDYLIVEEADQLIQLCQEAAEAHRQLGEQEQALIVYGALLGFLRSRGWSEKQALAEHYFSQLQSSFSPSSRAPYTTAPAAPQPQRHALPQLVRQWTTRQLHLVLSKQQAVLITISLLLFIGIGLTSLGIGIWLHIAYQKLHPTNSTVILPSKATPHSDPTSARTSTTTPSPSTSVNIAKEYNGTLQDIPTGITTNIALSQIQQQYGNISGYLGGMPTDALYSGIPTNGPFKGTITTENQIQFTLTNDTGQATFSFEGGIQPDGTLAGTYCNLGVVAGHCSDYGIWSVSPAT